MTRRRTAGKALTIAIALGLGAAACSSGSGSTTSSSTSGSTQSSVAAVNSTPAASSTASSTGSSTAAWKPKHDITFIVPYAAGGGSDAQARRLVPDLKKALGVGVHIVYKTGGSGAVGFLALHQAKPDGYTISNVVTPNIVVTSIGKDVGYQAGDFSYVAMTEASPGALAVGAKSKFATLKDFVDYAKANPGKVTIAGTGDTGKAGTAEILAACGIKATYVPVSGGVGAIIPDVVGGHVDAAFMPASDVLLHKDSIRALGIAGSEPSPTLPDVPTFKAAGYPGFTIGQAWGVMAPPNTPDNIVQALNAAVEQAVQDSKVQAALKADGLTPLTQTPAQAKQFIADTVQGVKKDQQLVAQMGK